MKKEKLPSQREAVILSILLNGEKYGRQIRDDYEQRTGKKIPFGSLYTTLSRMKEHGYVRSWIGESNSKRGGNRRKYFEMTGTGQRALNSFQLFITNAFENARKTMLS